MFECCECGAIFETPALEKERNHYGDWDRVELFPRCPICGSEEFEKACDDAGESEEEDEQDSSAEG